jgi:NhaP-type Na+/H+ or K+/H+ antiporter
MGRTAVLLRVAVLSGALACCLPGAAAGGAALLTNATNATAHESGHSGHGGSGEVTFITVVLFIGFMVDKVQPLCCHGAVPYTVWLLLIGLVMGGLHLATIYDYTDPANPVYSGHINPSGGKSPICDTSLPTCTSWWTGAFFNMNLMENIDPHAIMFVFLPPLIFESAFYVDQHIFLRSFKSILAMAFVGVTVATLVTGGLIMLVYPAYDLNPKIVLDEYGAFLPAMLAGVTLSATDPVAVVGLLNTLGAPKALSTLIEGESLLNDGSAYGIFLILFEMTKYALVVTNVDDTSVFLCDPNHHAAGCVDDYSSVAKVVRMFVNLVFVAGLEGIAVGWISIEMIGRIYNNNLMECIVTMLAAYGTWIFAEATKASGVLAVVACGIYMGMHKERFSGTSREFIKEFWETLCWILNTLLFVMSGIVIGTTVFDSRNLISLGKDVWLLLILYLIIHVARGASMLVLQPCLNKGVCKGKYSKYDFNWRHSVVMWWGGLRGAVGLALGLIVAHDPLWGSLDQNYCAQHGCCGDGTPGSGACWQRHKYFQGQFNEIFLFHVGGIVLMTIVINGISTGTIVKRLRLGKVASTLDKLNFARVCSLIDKEMTVKMNKLQANESAALLKGPGATKDTSRIQWEQVYRYLPITVQEEYEQRVQAGLISRTFGSRDDEEHPPRLREKWARYHNEFGEAQPKAERPSTQPSVVMELAQMHNGNRLHEITGAAKELEMRAIEICDLRIKYVNLVKEKYWELVSEGYLPAVEMNILKRAEDAQKDAIDDHLAKMHQRGFVAALVEGQTCQEKLKQAYLGGGAMCQFTADVKKHTEPPSALVCLIIFLNRFPLPWIKQFFAGYLNFIVTRDYSLVENFIHAHHSAIHHLKTRHEDLIDAEILHTVVAEAENQVSEAQTVMDGLDRVYERVVERHETVTAAMVMLEHQEDLVREKEESGELHEDNARLIYDNIIVSKQQLKAHPQVYEMNTTLADYVTNAAKQFSPNSPANFIKFVARRMPVDALENFKLDILKKANQTPIYLRSHDIVYLKGKPDLYHHGPLNRKNMMFYLIVKGKVSVVTVDDAIEQDRTERERHYRELQLATIKTVSIKLNSPRRSAQVVDSATVPVSHETLTLLNDKEKTKEVEGSPSVTDAFIDYIKRQDEAEQPKSVEQLLAMLHKYKDTGVDKLHDSVVKARALAQTHRTAKKMREHTVFSHEEDLEKQSLYNHLRVLSKKGSEVRVIDQVKSSQSLGGYELNAGMTERKFTAVCTAPTLMFAIDADKFVQMRETYPQVHDYATMRILYEKIKDSKELLGGMVGLQDAVDKFGDCIVVYGARDDVVSVPEDAFFVHANGPHGNIKCEKGPTTMVISKAVLGAKISADDKVLYGAGGFPEPRQHSLHRSGSMRQLLPMPSDLGESVIEEEEVEEV